MGKIIDISAKLTNEKPKLKLSEDKVFEIDDRKNTILQMNQKFREADFNNLEVIDDVIKLTLGEAAAKEIDKMNLPFSVYQSIFVAIMAAVMGEEYETVEARFRKEAAL